MAYVIDTRSNGGEYVIIGDVLTLPSSSAVVVTGDAPMAGSLRYNDSTAEIEVFAVLNDTTMGWRKIYSFRGQYDLLTTIGGTLTGNLIFSSGRLFASNGLITLPSISFNNYQNTGLSVSSSGNLQLSTNSTLALTVSGTNIVASLPVVASSVTSAKYESLNGALAARFAAPAVYDLGTVVVFGGANEITTTTTDHSPLVAGVVISSPGLGMNSGAGSDTTYPYVAFHGRTQAKCIGPISFGDILVTSSTAGYAQALGITSVPQTGTVGIALGNIVGTGTLALINIMVTR